MNQSVRPYQKHNPIIRDRVYIDPAACVIGNVTIGEDSSIWPAAVIRGDVHSICIGKRTSIQDGSVLHVTHAGPYCKNGMPLNVGDNVTIGHNVTLHGCTIKNDVLVGMGAIIMDGAIVNSVVLIAAGTVVTPGKTLETGYLYKGNPARKGRPLTEKERQFFKYSSNYYVKLKNFYLREITQ